MTEKKKGPMPTGKRFRNMPVPFFFQERSAEKFMAMEMKESDVVMSSPVKGGTTWMHQILCSLLYKFDDNGDVRPGFEASMVGRDHQVYPDAVDPEPIPESARNIENESGMDKVRREFFGYTSFEDIESQPEPRLFSTHFCGDMLPSQLTDPSGKGKLVVVLRNFKDILSSLHFFRGEAKDGWYGNEFGPGSLARFVDPDCPNAYGSVFDWVAKNDQVVSRLEATGRVCVVYYEGLKMNISAQLDRLNNFLGLSPLTNAKREAVMNAVDINTMKNKSSSKSHVHHLLRKGVIGDWKLHMSREDWNVVDSAFSDRLTGVPIAEPLLFFQYWEVPGIPSITRQDFDDDTDPRDWPSFPRATLREGFVVPDHLIPPPSRRPTSDIYKRPPSEYSNGIILPREEAMQHGVEEKYPGKVIYPAASGRYHLFVSGVCPWATGTRAARTLLGLEDVLSMDIADFQSGAGWVFMNGVSCAPWNQKNENKKPFFLHELYQLTDPLGTTRLTVPVLWDQETNTIVSNDSWGIIKMLSTAFGDFRKPNPISQEYHDLYPKQFHAEIEEIQSDIYPRLLNGVYRSGVALVKQNILVSEEVREQVYNCLNELETRLSNQQYLVANSSGLTAVDIRLFMCLVRYDAAYRFAFSFSTGVPGKPSLGGGAILCSSVEERTAYPSLRSYMQRVYAQLKTSIDWPTFFQYYRWTVAHPATAPLPSVKNLRLDAENLLFT